MNLRQLDKKYFGRHGEPNDVIVGNSADSYLTDARGRKYIDFMMGWCVGNPGWGNTEIRAARLSQMTFKGKATIQGKGFAIGIEVEDETYASEIGDACRENGLLVSAEEDILMLFPALTISRQTAQRGLDIFEKCL
jgi:4-aminobutyrate aminotransferase-like enzyme